MVQGHEQVVTAPGVDQAALIEECRDLPSPRLVIGRVLHMAVPAHSGVYVEVRKPTSCGSLVMTIAPEFSGRLIQR